MATAAVVGLSTGKRLMNSSFYHSDLSEKLSYFTDHASVSYQVTSTKSLIISKKTRSNYIPSLPSAKALKEHLDTASTAPSSAEQRCCGYENDVEDESFDLDYSVEALLLLQKSMLEKQWSLSFERVGSNDLIYKKMKKIVSVTCSGVSARHRRANPKKKTVVNQNRTLLLGSAKQFRSIVSPELIQRNRSKGYVKGVVSEEVLSHTEVVRLSKKIKTGLRLDEQKSRLKEKLGCEPSDEQLASSLRISRTELQSTIMECDLAREKLAMSNVRLVMSIAQRYDNMGAEMADLVQGGLIGLLRGIEKFDSSKGFRISTYVYWWIRQGVSRALMENSRTLRLPAHLHERLSLIRKAKNRLEGQGVAPTIERIAQNLNMSQKKVKNATEAASKVFSLDRNAFPSLNGLPGETHHSYIADNRLENNPWHGYDEWALKDEVKTLLNLTLGERESEIIRLYYGLDKECLTWEDISKRIGLSRERVRQVGLVALEKLKHAARNRKMESMLIKH